MESGLHQGDGTLEIKNIILIVGMQILIFLKKETKA